MSAMLRIACVVILFCSFLVPVRSLGQDVALALSGGGARGFAQIGVLEVLEAEGIPIKGIAGTSIGAILGGLYASGYTPQQLDSMLSSQNWEALLSLNDGLRRSDQYLNQKFEEDRSLITLHFKDFEFVVPEAAASGYRISELLNELVLRAPFQAFGNFDSLGIPFRAVATDLIHGKLVVISDGDLSSAMRASSTIPLQFAPLERDSMILIDGGLLANIPERAAREFGAEFVIGVNTTSPLHEADALNTPWNVADQAISILMKKFADQSLDSCDLLITPDLEGITSTDFHRIPEIIERGRKAARAAIPKLQSIRNNSNRSYNRIHSINVRSSLSDVEAALTTLSSPYVGYHFSPEMEYSLARECNGVVRKQTGNIGRVTVSMIEPGVLLVEFIPVYIHSITLPDELYVHPSLVERELQLRVGELFNIDDAMLTWRNLIASDLFSDAQMSIHFYSQDSVDVSIDLKEGGTQRVSMGLRIDNERNTQLSLDLIENSIVGTGLRFSAYLAGGERNQKIQSNLHLPRILDTYWTIGLRGYLERENVRVYSTMLDGNSYQVDQIEDRRQEQYGVRFFAGRQLSRSGVLLASLRFAKQRTYNLGEAKSDYKALATIAGSAIIDTRDYGTFSSAGDELVVSFESSLVTVKNDVKFSRAEFRYSTYFSFGAHTLIPHIHLGVADRTTPEIEQFYLGGENMFWGLREHEHVGTQLFSTGFGWRTKLPVRVFFDTYAQVHYQAGNVWNQPTDITFKRLRQGVALQFLFDTPVGPASFSVARSFFFDEAEVLIAGPTLSYFSIGVPL